jgi:hypothetical protein
MWDILSFLKNPPSDGVMEKNAATQERIRQINEQLEDAIENPRPEHAPEAVKDTDAIVAAEGVGNDEETPGKKIKKNVPGPAQPKPAAEDTGKTRGETPETAQDGKLVDISVDMVEPNPFQPRKELGEQEIAE